MPGKVKACWGSAAAAPSADEKAKVSAADTTTNYLDSKIVAGTGISKTILNPGANETLSIACTITDTDIKAKVSANDTTTNYLDSKIVAGTGISKTILNPGANETLSIACTITDTDIKAKVSAADTTTDYLNSKIVAGTGISKTILNPGANETLQISASAAGASQNWHSMYLPVKIGNPYFGAFKELSFGTFPNIADIQEYDYFEFLAGDETGVGIGWQFAMPFNWKPASSIKCCLYWFVTGEGSHGVETKWQIRIRAIGDGEALSFTGVWVNNYDTEAANDLLYITPIVTIAPTKAGTLDPNDLLQIFVRRQNDSASGPAGLLGIKICWEIDPTIAVP